MLREMTGISISRIGSQIRPAWVSKHLRILYPIVALLPALWLLIHPVPAIWLRPLCKGTWAVLAVCALAASLPALLRRKGATVCSLVVIALTQAVFQAWCYNTGSHPAGSPFQIWGILPSYDSQLYYTSASELLDGRQIAVMFGGRHPFPVLFALLLKISGHDFRLVTLILTLLVIVATWSAFEVIRLRLGGAAATVFLACTTFYVRIHGTGLFMSEQLALVYALCAVAMLVES